MIKNLTIGIILILRVVKSAVQDVGDMYKRDIFSRPASELVQLQPGKEIDSIFDDSFKAFSVLRNSTQISKSLKDCTALSSVASSSTSNAIAMICRDPGDVSRRVMVFTRFNNGAFSEQKFIDFSSILENEFCHESFTGFIGQEELVFLACSGRQKDEDFDLKTQKNNFTIFKVDLSKEPKVEQFSLQIPVSDFFFENSIKMRFFQIVNKEKIKGMYLGFMDSQGSVELNLDLTDNRKIYFCDINDLKDILCSNLDLTKAAIDGYHLYDFTLDISTTSDLTLYTSFQFKELQNQIIAFELKKNSKSKKFEISSNSPLTTYQNVKAASFGHYLLQNSYSIITYVPSIKQHIVSQYSLKDNKLTNEKKSNPIVYGNSVKSFSTFGYESNYINFDSIKGYNQILILQDYFKITFLQEDSIPILFDKSSNCFIIYENYFLKSFCNWNISLEFDTTFFNRETQSILDFVINLHPISQNQYLQPVFLTGIREKNFWDIEIQALDISLDIILDEFFHLPFNLMEFHSNQVKISPNSGVEMINQNFKPVSFDLLIPKKIREKLDLTWTGLIQRHQILAVNKTHIMLFRNKELLVYTKFQNGHIMKKFINYFTQQKTMFFTFIDQDGKTVIVDWDLDFKPNSNRMTTDTRYFILNYEAKFVKYDLSPHKGIIRVGVAAEKKFEIFVKRDYSQETSFYEKYWEERDFGNYLTDDKQLCVQAQYMETSALTNITNLNLISNCNGYNFVLRGEFDDDKKSLKNVSVLPITDKYFANFELEGCVFSNSAVFYDRSRRIIKMADFGLIEALKEIDLNIFNFDLFGEFTCSTTEHLLVLIAYRINPITGKNSSSLVGISGKYAAENDKSNTDHFRNRILFIETDLPFIVTSIRSKVTADEILLTLTREGGVENNLFYEVKMNKSSLFFKVTNMTRETQKRYITFQSYALKKSTTSFGLRLTEKMDQCLFTLKENNQKKTLKIGKFKLKNLIDYTGALLDVESNSDLVKITPRYNLETTEMMSEFKWIYKFIDFTIPNKAFNSPDNYTFVGLLNEDALIIKKFDSKRIVKKTYVIENNFGTSIKYRISDIDNNIVGFVSTKRGTDYFLFDVDSTTPVIVEVDSSGDIYKEYAFSLHLSNVHVYGAKNMKNTLKIFSKGNLQFIFSKLREIEEVNKFDIIEFSDSSSLVMYSLKNQKYLAKTILVKDSFSKAVDLLDIEILQSSQILDINCQTYNESVVNCFVLSNCFIEQIFIYKNLTLERYDYDTYTYSLYPGIVPLSLSLSNNSIVVSGFQPDKNLGWFLFYTDIQSDYNHKKKVPQNAFSMPIYDIDEMKRSSIGGFSTLDWTEDYYFISPSKPTVQILRLFNQSVEISSNIKKSDVDSIRIAVNSEVGRQKIYNISSFFQVVFLPEPDRFWKAWWFWLLVIVIPIISSAGLFYYCKYGRVPKRKRNAKSKEYVSMEDDDQTHTDDKSEIKFHMA